ncbi:MAG: Rieske (2Fe-2S) protein [Rhizobacter sp.]|nr:Rieske (2Fe-2S) protein [Rhizobacter sp.]
MSSILPCSCHAERPVSGNRRKIVKIAAAGIAVPWVLSGGRANAKPSLGDRLVDEDAEGAPTPLRVSDLRPGKPVLAFPFDAAKGEVRSGSRLNKVVLMRFAETEMNAETRARSAGGVVAFSAICTHQGCDVKTWLPTEQALVCFCHSTKFLLLDGGSVASGPALRSLPSLPLSLDGDQLVIAGPFSAPAGGTA